MEYHGTDPFISAAAGNQAGDYGDVGIRPTRTGSESSSPSGESGVCSDKVGEAVQAATSMEPGRPDLPSPSRPISDSSTCASDSHENRGLEEEELGADSAEPEKNPSLSPPGEGHADSSSLECATVIDPSTSPWKKRKRFGIIPEHRKPLAGRSALESIFRKFGDRKTEYVVASELGMEFDSLQEAHDFYILYSWELGFGIRYGPSKLNPSKCKIAQDIVCGCVFSVCLFTSVANNFNFQFVPEYFTIHFFM